MKTEKQLLDELTWPEAYEKISGTTAAFVPVGPQEGHGRCLPMGTDMYIATATGILASKKAEGIVLHPLAYTFTGATNGYRGTICIPMQTEMEMIKAIIRNLWQQNFRAIFVVSVHGPDCIPAEMAIRDLFESEKIVASYFNPLTVIGEEKYHRDGFGVEAACCYAAMEILGLANFIPSLETLKDEESPALDFPGFKGLNTGCHYTNITHHAPTRKVDMEAGRKMLEEASEILAAKVESLAEYSRFIEKGGNPPYVAKP
jgi:hypothetical protein